MRQTDKAMDVLLNPRVVKSLISIGIQPKTVSKLSKKFSMDYIALRDNLKILENRGLISSYKVGREKKLSLTSKGIEIAKKLSEIINLLERIDNYNLLNFKPLVEISKL